MGKLPQVSPRQVIRVLEKSGFVFVRQKGSHAQYIHSSDRTRHATVALHSRDVPKKELASILNQSKISREDFVALL